MEKYEIVKDDYVEECGERMYRIRALRDIPRHNVKAGDLGGYIQRYENLSQTGDAWVADNAIVVNSALVSDDALVCDTAQVIQDAHVAEQATVAGSAIIAGDAAVAGAAAVVGKAVVFGRARVLGCASVHDKARCYGDAVVSDNASVHNDAQVYGNATIRGDAHVTAQHDWVYISHVSVAGYKGHNLSNLTAYRDAQGRICITCGVLNGPLDSPEVSQWLTGTVLSDVLNACMAEPVQENSD